MSSATSEIAHWFRWSILALAIALVAGCRGGEEVGGRTATPAPVPAAAASQRAPAASPSPLRASMLHPRRVDVDPSSARHLLVMEARGEVQVWRLGLPGDHRKELALDAQALDARFAGGGKAIVVGDRHGGVSLWSRSGERLWRHQSAGSAVRAVVPAGDLLLFGDDRGSLMTLRYDGTPVAEPAAAHAGAVLALAVSPDGRVVLSEGIDTRLRGWRLREGRLEEGRDYRPVNENFRSMLPNLIKWDVQWGWDRSIAFSPDGRTFASAGFDGVLRLSAVSGELVAEWPRAHGGHHVRAVAFAPDGEWLVSGGFDRSVRLWQARPGAEAVVARGNLRAVSSVAVGVDGRIYSAGIDGTVRIWDRTGKTAGRLPRDRPPQQRRGGS